MKFIDLINAMKCAPTHFHQTIDLWNRSSYICRMKTDSELVRIYGDYTVVSIMGSGDEQLRVEIVE